MEAVSPLAVEAAIHAAEQVTQTDDDVRQAVRRELEESSLRSLSQLDAMRPSTLPNDWSRVSWNRDGIQLWKESRNWNSDSLVWMPNLLLVRRSIEKACWLWFTI
jgi:anti-sigma-K factor RskA